MLQRLILCALALVAGLLSRPQLTAVVHHVMADLPAATGSPQGIQPPGLAGQQVP